MAYLIAGNVCHKSQRSLYHDFRKGKGVPFLIGTDEAGYGPNLGPLTVTGCMWQVPDLEVDLYDLLSDVVSSKSSKNKLFVADSKAVYKSSGGIKSLESNVLPFVVARYGSLPSSLSDLVQMLDRENESTFWKDVFWLAGADLELPLAADTHAIAEDAARLTEAFRESEIALEQIEARAVFPEDFNRRLVTLGNKASLLSAQTLQIVADLKSNTAADHALKIMCDKHGGRSKYFGLIQQYLTESFVRVEKESLEISSYRWEEGPQAVEAHFVARGEFFLPTALASMFSKYLRELHMKLWNQFWQLKIPDLKSTKGYPVDAKRFKKEIEVVQGSLGIDDDLIWRRK